MSISTRAKSQKQAASTGKDAKRKRKASTDSGSEEEVRVKKKKARARARRGHKRAVSVEEVTSATEEEIGEDDDEVEFVEFVDDEDPVGGGDEQQKGSEDDEDDGPAEAADGGQGEGSELGLPANVTQKVDQTADLLTIFSDRRTVRFKTQGGKVTEARGRWCMLCKEDKKKVAQLGGRAGWYSGGNSTCCRHIAAMHYDVYHKRCKAAKASESKAATPKAVLDARKLAAEGRERVAAKQQSTLDGVVRKIETPTVFSRPAIFDAVTKHIVCGDQALLLANNVTFTNCLVTMRPKTKREDLPTRATVYTRIQNEFGTYMSNLRKNIEAAIGDVSSNFDLWTEDHASIAYFGMIGQWIDTHGPEGEHATVEYKWALRSEVVAMHEILGEHNGANLGRYLLKFSDRVGITSKTGTNKMGRITADNASNNGTATAEVERVLTKRGVLDWDAGKNRLSCIAHVVQLGIEDFMTQVTQVALVQSKQAMWDFDPTLATNRLAAGGLDVIAMIRTLAIKIQASPQRKEAFKRAQRQIGIDVPLVIPLHGNTRWGSAHGMCERAFRLREAIDSFVATADAKFGPITIIRKDGKIAKKIPWSAFRLEDSDWKRVSLCTDILADANRYHQLFSADKVPTIHRVIPALESLCTKWENKLDDAKYALFHSAIRRGLDKLGKYYTKLDNSEVYVLSLLLHPYYKLSYIEQKWGGEKEQLDEIDAGNPDAINWTKHAHEIVDDAMALYWPKRLNASTADTGAANQEAPGAPRAPAQGRAQAADSDSDDDFDRARLRRLQADPSGGWKAELKRYLDDPGIGTTKHTDTVEYWWEHRHVYPTLARMALDILPIPASSVAVERLFSRAREVSTDRRSRLGPDLFEWLECLHHFWRSQIVDFARINSEQVEDVDLMEFSAFYEVEELFDDDNDA
ncbi:Zinc finger BED domain-containing protein RICESLEEPER 2 [Trametes pubescens]|uniref:Zinc finger BED domain-containing protein RICESLEEPER 2 n=1 Tax=Trametes pubescens TaxID=154538 RepID=A0A1M2VG38_TRAPU|nr:Zinc finger BED domain-containing protein RICESLEEPER 2 [Trametes pubescens]